MTEAMMLRIRHPNGMSTLDTLTSSSTIEQLKQEISKLIGAKPSQLALRAGYPPAPLNHSDSTKLSDADISSGESIIVEVVEAKEEIKSIDSSISQAHQSRSKDTKTAEEHSSIRQPAANPASHGQPTGSRTTDQTAQASNNRASGHPSTLKGKDDFFNIPRDMVREEGSNEYVAKHSEQQRGSEPDYSQFALTQEEQDAQLAKIMQESLGGLGVDNDMDLEDVDQYSSVKDPRLRPEAPGTQTSTGRATATTTTTSQSTHNKGKEKSAAEMDEEYARGLQQEFYGEEQKSPSRLQPRKTERTNRNQQMYEPADVYDITKEYNKQNNLPDDPPLKEGPYDDMDVRGQGIARNPGPGAASDPSNEELERAIQASLEQGGRMGGGVIDPMNATMDDEEFKRILERSKQEK